MLCVSHSSVVLSIAILVVSAGSASASDHDYTKSRAKFEEEVAYWRSFDAYKNAKESARKTQSRVLSEALVAKARQSDEQSRKQRLDLLEASALEYRKSLASHSDSDRSDQVMINLAETLMAKHELTNGTGPELAEIISVLRDHEKRFRRSKNAMSRLLILARVELARDKNKSARALLNEIVKVDSAENPDAYVYASLMLGDSAFAEENSSEAMTHFERALRVLDASDRMDNHTYQRISLLYRLAWASYRAAKLEQSIGYARQILVSPERYTSDIELAKIRLDAAEILGNSLFELDNDSITTEYLKMRSLSKPSSQIATVILTRYLDAGLQEEALEFLEKVAGYYSQPVQYPHWLALKVEAASKLKRTEAVLGAKEDLVGLASPQHPWRRKHLREYQYIESIDKLAPSMGTEAMQDLLVRGRSAQSNEDLNRVATMAQILEQSYPDHKLKTAWLAARAEALYHLGKVEESCARYDQLIGGYKLESEQLDSLMYQRVLCAERRLVLAINNRDISEQSRGLKVNAAVADLEDHANAYANRFPSRERTSDVLLVVASALRDSGKPNSARKYWERVLLAKSSPAQRGLAIRGVIYASLQGGDSRQTAEQVERFLKIENWKKIGEPLRNELLGILAQSTMDAGKALVASGDMQSAGVRMLRSADLVKDLPSREKIYRDGAYMLAVAGDWTSALAATEDYLKNKFKLFRGDMSYLNARATEYQLNFSAAAKSYLAFAKEFPAHEKSLSSLERSEQLSAAEGDHLVAASASIELASRQTVNAAKLRMIEKSATHSLKAGAYEDAIKATEMYKKEARIASDRLHAEYLTATILVASEKAADAASILRQLDTKYLQNRKGMPEAAYLKGRSRANLLLAKVYRDELLERQGEMYRTPVRDLTPLFDRCIRTYDLAIQGSLPELMSEARYEAATIAEQFAKTLRARAKESGDVEASTTIIQRLEKLAAKYHSENVIARHKSPERYRNNKWVGLSALRVNQKSDAFAGRVESRAPVALSTDMPSNWSLQ